MGSSLNHGGDPDCVRQEAWALVILDLGVDTTTKSGEMIANVIRPVRAKAHR